MSLDDILTDLIVQCQRPFLQFSYFDLPQFYESLSITGEDMAEFIRNEVVQAVVLIVVTIVALATTGTATGIAGAIAAGGLFFLVLALIIVAAAVLSILARLAQQACVIDNLGVVDSIRGGYSVSVDSHLAGDCQLYVTVQFSICRSWKSA